MKLRLTLIMLVGWLLVTAKPVLVTAEEVTAEINRGRKYLETLN